ncbi:6-phosphogluconolactonase [Dysgonomonas macrotermitis]|uniref:6-phosphogluconolactonase n=1 Tax=Dysgonomonas macrotermitis TaxID=1346286 RepID=A0A1M5D8X2_9BACT|nr:6-phosphogluconolactonase [Dysgonomonas macrotermitis]SHF63473.1 6-phosphogluconolactonase [Dysgonomonas macrotermitis]
MMKDIINIYKDGEALSEGFTKLLNDELAQKERVNISLSGGTTPKTIFKYWSEKCQDSVDWRRLIFYWGDERCVLPGNENSNYGMTKEYLFNNVPAISKRQIHRIHGEGEPDEEAIWYSNILKGFVPYENEIPSFDIMMLGLGDDGHTVSIFPYQIDLWDSPENCVVAKHPESGMTRISLSGKVVNNSHNIAFLAMGKGKAEKVKQIIEQRDQFFDKYPAARVNPSFGKLYWFLDEEAASLL